METGHFLKMLNSASLAPLWFLIKRVHRYIICKNLLWVLQCKVSLKNPVWLPDYMHNAAIRRCLRSSTSNIGVRYTRFVVHLIQIGTVQWRQVYGPMKCGVTHSQAGCAGALSCWQCYGWPTVAALTASHHGSRHRYRRLCHLTTQTPGPCSPTSTLPLRPLATCWKSVIKVSSTIEQRLSWYSTVK